LCRYPWKGQALHRQQVRQPWCTAQSTLAGIRQNVRQHKAWCWLSKHCVCCVVHHILCILAV
jgi:hypothetical protein